MIRRLSPAQTEAGNRQIPIIEPLKSFLKEYLQSLDGVYLFTRENGGLVNKSSYHKMWESILLQLNTIVGGTASIKPIHDLTAHILRHTYATSLYYAGIDVKTAQKLLAIKAYPLHLIYIHI